MFFVVKEDTHGQRKRENFDSEIRIPNVSQTPRASWRRVLFLKRTHSPRAELFAGNTRGTADRAFAKIFPTSIQGGSRLPG